MFAPHIPPPSYSISAHQTWQRIKIILLSSFIGLCAGAAAAAAMVAWLFPVIAGGNVPVFFSYHPADPVSVPFDQAVIDDVVSKMIPVYGAVRSQGEVKYFDPYDLLSEAIPVSSDGWFVITVTSSPRPGTMWYVVGTNGAYATTTQIVFDPLYQLAYFKINRSTAVWGGKPLGFAREPLVGDRVYMFSHAKLEPGIVETGIPDKESLLTSGAIPTLRVAQVSASSGFAVDRSGRLVGIQLLNGLLLTPKYFEDSLPTIFSHRPLVRFSVGVMGWFSEQAPIFSGTHRVTGFVVTKTLDKNSLLKKGDIVEKFGNNVVRIDGAWYTVGTTSTTSLILRDGKEQKVDVDFVPLGT